MSRVDEMYDFWNQKGDVIRDMSHCHGFGRWKNVMKWVNDLGDVMFLRLSHILKIYEKQNDWKPRILDFGCGGGSNLIVLNTITNRKKIVGVDISDRNLNQAAAVVDCDLVHYDPDKPEELIERIGRESVDIVTCTYVFQHFPSAVYTQEVITMFSTMLKKGGLFLVQFRYDEGLDDYTFPAGKYEDQFIRAGTWNPDYLKDRFSWEGLEVKYIEFQPDRDDYCWFGGIRRV